MCLNIYRVNLVIHWCEICSCICSLNVVYTKLFVYESSPLYFIIFEKQLFVITFDSFNIEPIKL